MTGSRPGWKRTAVHPVGGLYAVGFARDSELLLVLSHSGRGVFDCASGQRVARSNEEFYSDDPLVAEGIGPVAGETVAVAGINGGALAQSTADRWSITLGSTSEVKLCFDGETLELGAFEDVRAAGFSPKGQHLVIAEPHSLYLFTRQ